MYIPTRDRPDPPLPVRQSRGWNVAAAVVGVVAGVAARRGLERSWRAVRDEEAPRNPADASVEWKDAIAFAAVSGVVVALARVAARRAVAGAWENRRGQDLLPARWVETE